MIARGSRFNTFAVLRLWTSLGMPLMGLPGPGRIYRGLHPCAPVLAH